MKRSTWCLCWIFLLCPAVQSFAGWNEEGASPKIEIVYKVVLSSAMDAALLRYDPYFKVWDADDFSDTLRGIYEYKSFHPWKSFLSGQSPAAVIGDFNGDGRPDAVLLGRNKTRGRRIVVLSGNTGYSVSEFTENYPLVDPLIHRSPYKATLEEYLEFVAPGKIKGEPAYGRPELDLKNDAFKFGVFERSSGLYFYDAGGKLMNYTLSD